MRSGTQGGPDGYFRIRLLYSLPPIDWVPHTSDVTDESMSFTVDWDAAMASVNQDRELLKMVIDAFVQESVQIQDGVTQAIDTKDASLLQRSGHTLKGTMMSLGAAPWSELAEKLEELGAAGSTEGASSLMAELEEHMPELLQQLGSFSP